MADLGMKFALKGTSVRYVCTGTPPTREKTCAQGCAEQQSISLHRGLFKMLFRNLKRTLDFYLLLGKKFFMLTTARYFVLKYLLY